MEATFDLPHVCQPVHSTTPLHNHESLEPCQEAELGPQLLPEWRFDHVNLSFSDCCSSKVIAHFSARWARGLDITLGLGLLEWLKLAGFGWQLWFLKTLPDNTYRISSYPLSDSQSTSRVFALRSRFSLGCEETTQPLHAGLFISARARSHLVPCGVVRSSTDFVSSIMSAQLVSVQPKHGALNPKAS